MVNNFDKDEFWKIFKEFQFRLIDFVKDANNSQASYLLNEVFVKIHNKLDRSDNPEFYKKAVASLRIEYESIPNDVILENEKAQMVNESLTKLASKF